MKGKRVENCSKKLLRTSLPRHNEYTQVYNMNIDCQVCVGGSGLFALATCRRLAIVAVCVNNLIKGKVRRSLYRTKSIFF